MNLTPVKSPMKSQISWIGFRGMSGSRGPELPAFDFGHLFGRNGPVEVEIGSGKGKFIIARAEQSPDVDFLAVDWSGKWLGVGEDRAGKRKLANLLFLRLEAQGVVRRIPQESVNVFHIYFPDPWPKKRHHKRRLLNADFFMLLREKLVPGGLVEIATDHGEYFEEIKAAADAVGKFWTAVRYSLNLRLHQEALKTNYEIKYECQNKSRHYLELKK
ncbi:MAG: hypothetical protein A2Z83_01030 [Omnitrophica bacterium GWA2_52_8]|nr:MAG: hypothetical protein A2Z83_01030 [Omnitrophica bacterium GWA2_52_8]